MADAFLTPEEVQRLTGFKQKSKQIEWLRANLIDFRVNALGYPIVFRGQFEPYSNYERPKEEFEPNLEGLNDSNR